MNRASRTLPRYAVGASFIVSNAAIVTMEPDYAEFKAEVNGNAAKISYPVIKIRDRRRQWILLSR